MRDDQLELWLCGRECRLCLHLRVFGRAQRFLYGYPTALSQVGYCIVDVSSSEHSLADEPMFVMRPYGPRFCTAYVPSYLAMQATQLQHVYTLCVDVRRARNLDPGRVSAVFS